MTMVELLIENGADVNSTESHDYNRTPLFYAAANEQTTMVKLLIKKGADVDSKD